MSSIPGLDGDTRRLALRAAGRDEITVSIGGQVLTVDASELQTLLDEALEDCAAYDDGPEGIERRDAYAMGDDR